MKKIFAVILLIILAIAVAYGMREDRVATSLTAFTLHDGESTAYTYEMTSFKVSFAILEGAVSPETLKQDGPLYIISISRLDSTAPELEFNFRTPGIETFEWKGMRFDLQFTELNQDEATIRIIRAS